MKVVQIMPEFGLAGAETMCENLSYELEKKGAEVVVVSLYNYHSDITERLEKNGLKVVYLDKKAGLDLSIITKIKKLLKKEKPDAIHTHRYVMQYAIPAAILSGVKTRVHTVHNIAQKENTRIARLLNYFFFHFAHVVPVALSEEIKKTVIDVYHINQNKIEVVYNGIDLTRCRPKNDYSLNEPIRLLHIGRFSEQKNHAGLIEAFERVKEAFPNTVLDLIGDGEKRKEIDLLVKEKGLTDSVNFLGLKNDVFSNLHDSDIFVLPSLYEGMPMTLIEAMGSGIPIVATRVGGIPDMLEDGVDARIVKVDEKEIANACVDLLKNELIRKQYGANSKKKSVIFSSVTMAESYLRIYEQNMCQT